MLQFILFIVISLSIGTAILWFYKGEKSEEIKSTLKNIFQSLKDVFNNFKKLFLLIKEISQAEAVEKSSESKSSAEENIPIEASTSTDEKKGLDAAEKTSEENNDSDQEILITPIDDIPSDQRNSLDQEKEDIDN